MTDNIAAYFQSTASYEAWQNRGRIYNWERKFFNYHFGFYVPVKINPSEPGYKHNFRVAI